MEVSAKVGKEPNQKVGKVIYDIPEDLAGLQKRFGDAVVAAHAHGSIVISLQALMRRHIGSEKGISAADLQKAVDAWKPDARSAGPKQSAFEKVSTNIDKLSPEERKALLAKLTGTAPAAAPKPAGQK